MIVERRERMNLDFVSTCLKKMGVENFNFEKLKLMIEENYPYLAKDKMWISRLKLALKRISQKSGLITQEQLIAKGVITRIGPSEGAKKNHKRIEEVMISVLQKSKMSFKRDTFIEEAKKQYKVRFNKQPVPFEKTFIFIFEKLEKDGKVKSILGDPGRYECPGAKLVEENEDEPLSGEPVGEEPVDGFPVCTLSKYEEALNNAIESVIKFLNIIAECAVERVKEENTKGLHEMVASLKKQLAERNIADFQREQVISKDSSAVLKMKELGRSLPQEGQYGGLKKIFYFDTFLKEFYNFSNSDRDAMRKAIWLLVNHGLSHSSLYSEKLKEKIQSTPNGAWKSRASNGIRFTWNQFSDRWEIYSCFYRGRGYRRG